MKTYEELWKESEKGAWAAGGCCPKCNGRAYVGGYCMDCGAYWRGDKKQMDSRLGLIDRFFDLGRGADL